MLLSAFLDDEADLVNFRKDYSFLSIRRAEIRRAEIRRADPQKGPPFLTTPVCIYERCLYRLTYD